MVGACVATDCETTVTDGNGEYAFADVAQRFVDMPSFPVGAVVVLPPATGAWRMSTFAELQRRQGIQVVNLVMVIGGRVGAPTLVGPDGSPAPETCRGAVHLTALSGTSDTRLWLYGHDFDGDTHHPGSYRVRMSPGGACPYTRGEGTVTVGAGTTAPATVTLTTPSSAFGTLVDNTGAAIAGAFSGVFVLVAVISCVSVAMSATMPVRRL